MTWILDKIANIFFLGFRDFTVKMMVGSPREVDLSKRKEKPLAKVTQRTILLSLLIFETGSHQEIGIYCKGGIK